MKEGRNWMYWVTAASFAGFGCGSSQGTEPHDMSVAQHEQAAGGEQAAAEQHAAQYDPEATEATTRCAKGGACWTSETNPTAEHQGDMAEHRELAAKHRGAAQALRDAEARACANIPEQDRDVSPFYHREDISSVGDVNRSDARGKAQIETARGARAVFRAVPGLTAEWLQRLVDCHMARAAAVGFEMPEMDYCPLMVKGARATVSSTGDGFAIVVTSDDPKAVEEIRRRVQSLPRS